MQLVGERIVLPVFDAELVHRDSIKICDGVKLFNLPPSYRDHLEKHPEMIARYQSSLQYMKTAISISPSEISGHPKEWATVLDTAIFCAMSLRLATGIPLDTPYWFDVSGEHQIEGCGISQMRTYRTGNRYEYPLDEGAQGDALNAFVDAFGEILDAKFNKGSSNPLVRAIEFASIAFQTHHIQSRVVNNTVFLEALFSGRNSEIAYQIAASVSWYLEEDEEERLALFKQVKDIYDIRSKIVHGADVARRGGAVKDTLELCEMLNSRLFTTILLNRHASLFGLSESKRSEQLRGLSLGTGAFMESGA